MVDVKTEIEWMKTIEASTRIDLDSPIVNLKASAVIASKWTGATGTVLKDLKSSAASSLSGTQLDIAIDIAGTPYYFTVYPTKA